MRKSKKRFVLKESIQTVLIIALVIITGIIVTCIATYIITGRCNQMLAFWCSVVCYSISSILDRYGRKN